jgi:hypothetical protein
LCCPAGYTLEDDANCAGGDDSINPNHRKLPQPKKPAKPVKQPEKPVNKPVHSPVHSPVHKPVHAPGSQPSKAPTFRRQPVNRPTREPFAALTSKPPATQPTRAPHRVFFMPTSAPTNASAFLVSGAVSSWSQAGGTSKVQVLMSLIVSVAVALLLYVCFIRYRSRVIPTIKGYVEILNPQIEMKETMKETC